jgi:hypothetical protein
MHQPDPFSARDPGRRQERSRGEEEREGQLASWTAERHVGARRTLGPLEKVLDLRGRTRKLALGRVDSGVEVVEHSRVRHHRSAPRHAARTRPVQRDSLVLLVDLLAHQSCLAANCAERALERGQRPVLPVEQGVLLLALPALGPSIAGVTVIVKRGRPGGRPAERVGGGMSELDVTVRLGLLESEGV